MLYAFIRLLVSLAMRVFYRLEVGGRLPEPGRPVLYCGNHPNGLLDPGMVLATSPRPIRFLAKAPLFKMPVLGWLVRGMGAVPVYRQQDGADTAQNARMFEAVVAALAGGGTVCIFPEGTSHSLPRLLRLKTGAARIALLAQQALPAGAPGVRVVPVGVTYANKQRFRTRALAYYGEPLEVAGYAALPGDDEVRMRALTDAIRESLARVCVELDRADDLPLLAKVDALYARERGLCVDGALSPAFPRWKRLLAGLAYHRARSPERVARLRRDVEGYLGRLERLGLDDEALQHRVGFGAAVWFVARKIVPLALAAPLAIAGAVMFYLPWKLPGWLAKALQPQPDIVATIKILTGMVVTALVGGGWIALAASLLGAREALLVALAEPLLGYVALTWAHVAEDAAEDVGVFLRLFGRQALREKLLARRRAIADELDALAAEVEAEELAQIGP